MQELTKHDVEVAAKFGKPMRLSAEEVKSLLVLLNAPTTGALTDEHVARLREVLLNVVQMYHCTECMKEVNKVLEETKPRRTAEPQPAAEERCSKCGAHPPAEWLDAAFGVVSEDEWIAVVGKDYEVIPLPEAMRKCDRVLFNRRARLKPAEKTPEERKQNWLDAVMDQAERQYASLPQWKRDAIERDGFLADLRAELKGAGE